MQIFPAFVFALLSLPVFAETKILEEQGLNFTVNTRELFKGSVQYAYLFKGPKVIKKIFPSAKQLDSLALMKQKDVKIFAAKTAFVVDRPVGFFDHEHMNNEKYVAHMWGEQKTRKMGPETYNVNVPGNFAHSYMLKSFTDSDDVSTLPNAKVIQGVTAAKQLDVISQSASTILFKEYTGFSKYFEGGTSVTAYIALKENKTLVITYHLLAVKKPFFKEKILKENFRNETAALKQLTETFRP